MITAEMVTGIVTEVTNVVKVVVPAGITLMGISMAVKALPKFLNKFF